MKKIILILLAIVALALVVVFSVAPEKVDRVQNQIQAHDSYVISQRARELHKSLIVGDWHVDSLLWSRDLSVRNDYGQLDIPRLQQGNVGLQMFTTVTKSPSGLNYEHNETSASDSITKLALVQRWPIATWTSLTARAEHQSRKLHSLAEKHPSDLMIIKSQNDLTDWQKKRTSNPILVGALLGTEGSHALDGKLDNVQHLFDHGFRMMSLQHFFDNKLGASLHGASQTGLTEFGVQVLEKMNDLNIIVDVSHSSESVVEDVLNKTKNPLVVSHTGFKGHCDTPRNISDVLMQKIAADGGLIAVGFWNAAVCGTHPDDIAGAIKYGIDLVGEDHVSLGSDFDGSVTTALDASELVAITHALLEAGVSEDQIRKVMGGNMLRFLRQQLPSEI